MSNAIDLTDHAANRAHLRTLVDKLANDSDYNNPPRVLRRDLIVIFLYLDEPFPPKKHLKEMEAEEEEQESPRERDATGDDDGETIQQEIEEVGDENEEEEGEDENEERDSEAGGTDEGNDVNSSAGAKLYTSWTDCLELMSKIALKFPYYMNTMSALWSDEGRKPMVLDRWTDAFAHYELPLQRRIIRYGCIDYRLNMNDAAQYLHERGHLAPARRASFLSLPAEVRAMIWKLVFTYPVSGVQFRLSGEEEELEPHMYTVSRNLNAKVSLKRFLDEDIEESDTTELDEVLPGVERARLTTDSLYKISAPMAINKALGIEAAQGFLKHNLFVFTKYGDMRVFFKRGAAGKQRNLHHVAFVIRGYSGQVFTNMCQLLALCVELRELHLFFARGSRIRPMPEFHEGFRILSLHARLKAIHCSANATEAILSQQAAKYIAKVLSDQGSSCKTYYDDVLVELGANKEDGEESGERDDDH